MLIYEEKIYSAITGTGQGMQITEYFPVSSSEGYKEKLLEQEHPRFVGQGMIEEQQMTQQGPVRVQTPFRFPIKAESLYLAFEQWQASAEAHVKATMDKQRSRIITP